jgi:hypothetical protein
VGRRSLTATQLPPLLLLLLTLLLLLLRSVVGSPSKLASSPSCTPVQGDPLYTCSLIIHCSCLPETWARFAGACLVQI